MLFSDPGRAVAAMMRGGLRRPRPEGITTRRWGHPVDLRLRGYPVAGRGEIMVALASAALRAPAVRYLSR